ncbi:unnamed protein product [Cuscuta campestris]|uniref:Reverse transcriptase domain-containing protein n=1 Tax=Cuscuta campestris TaxID=132261 RepID=A0A484L502_9ASTE|nr:unnamed protein product [Cuscuta campestris]
MEEVRNTIWQLDGDSASGPDGFNGNFFKSAWEIIKEDVLRASQEFFLGFPIPKAYGSTFLTLIPKKDNPRSFDDFRPISLSTFMSKINTKLLANRMKNLLPKIISEEQCAFQKGKSLDDHILLAKEAIHHLDRKVYGGNIIIKIDMAKAFDRMAWNYLEAVLEGFGFSKKAVNLLMASLRSSYFSILLNGEPNDDLMIFTKGDSRNLLKLKHILRLYLQASGQEVNFSKSREGGSRFYKAIDSFFGKVKLSGAQQVSFVQISKGEPNTNSGFSQAEVTIQGDVALHSLTDTKEATSTSFASNQASVGKEDVHVTDSVASKLTVAGHYEHLKNKPPSFQF